MTTLLKCPICGGTERSLLPSSVCEECGCDMKPDASDARRVLFDKSQPKEARMAAMNVLQPKPAARQGGERRAEVFKEAMHSWHDAARVEYERAEQLAATLENDTAYARRLATALHRAHYAAEAPQWEPFDGLNGLLSQIDNMVTGLDAMHDVYMNKAQRAAYGRIVTAACTYTPRPEPAEAMDGEAHPHGWLIYRLRNMSPLSFDQHAVNEAIAALSRPVAGGGGHSADDVAAMILMYCRSRGFAAETEDARDAARHMLAGATLHIDTALESRTWVATRTRTEGAPE